MMTAPSLSAVCGASHSVTPRYWASTKQPGRITLARCDTYFVLSIPCPPVSGAVDHHHFFPGTIPLPGAHCCGDTTCGIGCRWEPADDRPAGAATTTVDSALSACKGRTSSPYASLRRDSREAGDGSLRFCSTRRRLLRRSRRSWRPRNMRSIHRSVALASNDMLSKLAAAAGIMPADATELLVVVDVG